MSLQSLEREITVSARIIFCNSKLRVKDICEWSTGKVQPRDDEVSVELPDLGVTVSILKIHDKRK